MPCADGDLFWIYFPSHCCVTPVSSVYETPFSPPSSIHPARLQESASALNGASKRQNRHKMIKHTLRSQHITNMVKTLDWFDENLKIYLRIRRTQNTQSKYPQNPHSLIWKVFWNFTSYQRFFPPSKYTFATTTILALTLRLFGDATLWLNLKCKTKNVHICSKLSFFLELKLINTSRIWDRCNTR